MATIIMVDDEEELLENRQDFLEFKGYDSTVAHSRKFVSFFFANISSLA